MAKRGHVTCGLGAAVAAVLAVALAAMALAAADEPPAPDGRACARPGTWLDPATGEAIASAPLMAALARRQVVLLGESHDNPEHHRWQLQMLAALHALKPELVVGFEMFPRRVQPALDRWAAGTTDTREFLKQSEWREVWRFDPDLYLPLFHFVRQNRLPMIALNIDRALVSRVGREGWEAIPADQRGGLSDPAAPGVAYLKDLALIFLMKQRLGIGATKRPADKTETNAEEDTPPSEAEIAAVTESEGFKRFVAAQLTWDRAMAEALAEALAEARRKRPGSLAVGVLGQGHIQFGHGVPHQLADLGVADAAVLLPMAPAAACERLAAKIADAVFVVAPMERAAQAAPKPRLGVMIRRTEDGVRIIQVVKGSVAEASALAAGDIVVAAAGSKIEQVGKLVAIVQRQAPGTWLPLIVRRAGKEIAVVAKFPAAPDPPE